MVMKGVISLISNKRESFGGIEVKNTNYYYQLLRIILHLQITHAYFNHMHIFYFNNIHVFYFNHMHI